MNNLEREQLERRLQRSILKSCLDPLSNQLKDMTLEGGWFSDGLIVEMPVMSALEAMRLVPCVTRVVTYTENTESRRLSTAVVLEYAKSCCPMIIEPKFLRYNQLLNDHYEIPSYGILSFVRI